MSKQVEADIHAGNTTENWQKYDDYYKSQVPVIMRLSKPASNMNCMISWLLSDPNVFRTPTSFSPAYAPRGSQVNIVYPGDDDHE